ncbi:polysaccharide deacetylase family protein [Rhodococcus sp. 06-418-5]|uniref:polysaccharide deacetylase family protein n=1 Tax=Rhodococcus sp. 06-418-5 TaxID=2022507 RepID=UPI00211B4A57|nr:polysaccharide deacetylase family protein [Rhodococcus sp. 06-418-5]
MPAPAMTDHLPALTFLVSIELWGPAHVPLYAPMAAAWPIPGDDPHSRSWSEYGVHTGARTLLKLLAEHGLRATVVVNGAVAEQYPDLVRSVHDAGHEVAANSWTQDVVPAQLGEATERANLSRCTDAITAITGQRPVGWMSPRASRSPKTETLLAEQGYLWCGDHADRDRPVIIDTDRGPLVQMMHSDYSDVRNGGDPLRYRDLLVELVDVLCAGPTGGTATIALHAHVGGRPLLASMVGEIFGLVARRSTQLRIITRRQLAAELLAARQ